MADDATQATGQGAVTIPDDIKKKFPELVELITGSESMNNEERQYWINILPIMTPEQIQNLRDILDNEKQQLAEIDKKYSQQLSAQDQKKLIEKTQEERRRRREERAQKEHEYEEKDESKTEDLLQQIENL